jgi:hypothetical protein
VQYLEAKTRAKAIHQRSSSQASWLGNKDLDLLRQSES